MLVKKTHTDTRTRGRAQEKPSLSSYHEGVGPLVLELGPLPQVVKDASLVEVVQGGHVGLNLRVVRVRLPKPLPSSHHIMSMPQFTREKRTPAPASQQQR